MNIEQENIWIKWNNQQFYKHAKWKLKFAWLPKTCDLSKRKIWLETGYEGIYSKPVLVDFGRSKTIITDTRWITKQEFIFGKIKGMI